VLDAENKPVASGSTRVCVAKKDAGAGLDVRTLVVGDSLTAASVYPDEFYKLCQTEGNPRMTLLGNRPSNSSSEYLRHEGYGGWSFSMFCTSYADQDIVNGRRARSPFVFKGNGKPSLNFARYVKEQCGGTAPDVVTLALGTNDIFLGTDSDIESKIDAVFSYADKLIADIKAAGPNTKIGFLLLVPPAASQDAFAENYGCMQTRWQYRRNQHRYVERQFQKYGGREGEGLYLVPAYTNIDTVYGFPRREVFVNGRTDARIVRMVNGVHPSPEGYRQMADSIYCWLKNVLQSR
jgi:lysophospholipase L1-like esterase